MSLQFGKHVLPRILPAGMLALAVALGASACTSPAPSQGSGSEQRADQGSSSSSAKPGKVPFTDDLGRTVTVKNPKRVVVGMGSLADIWRDAGGKVVGVSDDAFSNFGFDKDKVAGVGRHNDLNLESIVALNPDFVILTAGSDSSDRGPSQDQLRESLEKSGIAVAFFKVETFDDYLRMLKVCTKITGRSDLYGKNGTEVAKRVEKAIDTYSVADTRPSVLVVTASSKGAAAQQPDHLASLMLKQLGAKLVTESNPSLLTQFSMEAVAEIDPDYIFVLPAATSDEQANQNYKSAIESDPAWAGIGAVKAGHVTVLDLEHFFRKPNNEWDQAYDTLGKALQSL